ncbi:ADP-ribosylglycohydrolase family protein [Vibrio diazotrophicus]|uniref:ADP-ribosylglycohydrolase family protein n=1 Tax=Vibrio diazotrophicus TaxID=685 RepID=UPI00142E640F|nr:ADP-ribosylglycohydrolase family protein [Vibrio diazotrophicus]NIY94485.1 ADP-ribosylglycohydrolase family protein [Vibrio diazotrophicus]
MSGSITHLSSVTPDLDRSRGCLVGLAVGDALGTTLEFKPPGTFKPITDMMGGGHFCLKKGYWTDDTSMALCLAHSLLECGEFDARDQMNKYCQWMNKGYMSSIGVCFDVGVGVSSALRRYQKTGDPYAGSKARWSSGNGSIMRLAPVPIFYQLSLPDAVFYAGESSRTTHGSALCVDACRYLSSILFHLIHGHEKQIFTELEYVAETEEIKEIQSGLFLNKSYKELTGSGYVIESLESALWCFMNTNSFESCVLAAANLGNDADTTAAIAGQLAGAHYGHQGIRGDWLSVLYKHEDILALSDELYALALNTKNTKISGGE